MIKTADIHETIDFGLIPSPKIRHWPNDRFDRSLWMDDIDTFMTGLQNLSDDEFSDLIEIAMLYRQFKVEVYFQLAAVTNRYNCIARLKQTLPVQYIFAGLNLGMYTSDEVFKLCTSRSRPQYQMEWLPEAEQFDGIFFEAICEHIDPMVLEELRANNWAKLRRDRCYNGISDLDWAIINDDLEELRRRVAACIFDFDQQAKIGIFAIDRPTLLGLAGYMGSIRCFRYLLINGSDPNGQSSYGWSNLECAMIGGQEECIRLLEETGASTDKCVDRLMTFHRNDIALWLLDTRDFPPDGATAAVVSENRTGLIMLSERGGIPRDDSGPLCSAVSRNMLDAVHFLINQIDVNAANADGSYPLYCAAFFGRMESAQLLIEHGADVNAAVNMKTPLRIAIDHHFEDLAEFLLSKGGLPSPPPPPPPPAPESDDEEFDYALSVGFPFHQIQRIIDMGSVLSYSLEDLYPDIDELDFVSEQSDSE